VRFGVWALAFLIDLSTPWFAVRHSIRVPINAAHLPERFGLFMLILLGDSVVAVMQGMESQEEWAPGAATSAFLGMAILFLLWWWYFEDAPDEGEARAETRRESLRFHLWSYAHLPLYLGIIVTGVGLRRIVTTASRTMLDPTEALLLPIALALVMSMMTVIGATAGTRARSTDWARHLGLTALTIATGIAGLTSPVAMVIALMALCLAQLTVTALPSQSSIRVEVL
jgi:low temperature requirement protein LtrA